MFSPWAMINPTSSRIPQAKMVAQSASATPADKSIPPEILFAPKRRLIAVQRKIKQGEKSNHHRDCG
jgi:hypothetical protein